MSLHFKAYNQIFNVVTHDVKVKVFVQRLCVYLSKYYGIGISWFFVSFHSEIDLLDIIAGVEYLFNEIKESYLTLFSKLYKRSDQLWYYRIWYDKENVQ